MPPLPSKDDATEAQSPGRSCRPGKGRSPLGKRRGDRCLVNLSRPDREESGDHAPDHPSQEGIGTDVDRDAVPVPPDSDSMHGPNRLRISSTEGAEVVATLEGRRGSPHRVHIQSGPHPERHALQERASRPVPDGVTILPVSRRVARLEARGCPSNVANRDIRRKQAVEGLGQLGRRLAPREGEGDDLPRRVDSGVCSTRAVDGLPDSTREVGQRRLERSLDGPSSRLQLEPGEVRAIVFNRCAVSDAPNRLRRAVSGACTPCRCYSPLSRARCKAPPSIGRERT